KEDFGVTRGSSAIGGPLMAAPAVRSKAMADKDQQKVWDEVHKSQQAMAASPSVVVAGAAPQIETSTSYARVMGNEAVAKEVDTVAAPVQRNYESLIHQLHDKNAVGVVVAVNGEVVWADLFASTQLLQKYWPKLVRSYATEAVVARAKNAEASMKQ